MLKKNEFVRDDVGLYMPHYAKYLVMTIKWLGMIHVYLKIVTYAHSCW